VRTAGDRANFVATAHHEVTKVTEDTKSFGLKLFVTFEFFVSS